MSRRGYTSDVSNEEWAFVAPYLTLMREDAPQREHSLREVFNGPRYVVKNGVSWRAVPGDLPPGWAIYQQTRCSVPGYGGTMEPPTRRDELWDRFYTAAPQRQRQSVAQSKVVKRA